MFSFFRLVFLLVTKFPLSLGEAAKKGLLLMAGPLSPNPPPLELNGRWNVFFFKVIFSLIARPFTPHPLARPLRGELFFAASLRENFKKINFFLGRVPEAMTPPQTTFFSFSF